MTDAMACAADKAGLSLLVLNGPNLNLLGKRNPEIYGMLTLEQLEAELAEYVHTSYPSIGELDFAQSNHEGTLIDVLHLAHLEFDGIVFNPAAYTHYSYALRDAIEVIDVPVVEVHLSNVDAREDFRSVSVVREVCIAHFYGDGIQSYKDAIAYLAERATE
ncbi:MAG: 3-dehydroquinate dehydratase [Coriobacteriia bacterium]|nr:3-dehydroquinate dehydratase [Coriobacteriia bacterium]